MDKDPVMTAINKAVPDQLRPDSQVTMPVNRHTMTCMNNSCGAEIEVVIPHATVLNEYAVSVIAAAHEKGTRCRKCGWHYIPLMAPQQQVQWMWQPAPEVVPERVVLAPSGLVIVK